MKLHFFCPTKFEIPSTEASRTQIFGIGKEKAEALAKIISQTKSTDFIFVYGCAGALNPSLVPGEIFLISHLFENSQLHEISVPHSLKNFPKAKLYTSEVLVPSAEEKSHLFKVTGADLVDMEMLFIWKNIPEDVRKRILFVRGISDSTEDRLDFLKTVGSEIKFSKSTFVSLKKMSQLLRFIRNFSKYKKRMSGFLAEVSSLVEVDEKTIHILRS